jgi:hypothetical protein
VKRALLSVSVVAGLVWIVAGSVWGVIREAMEGT